jgi:hypothetical protein
MMGGENFATVCHEPVGSQRMMKKGYVVREPLYCLAEQPREDAIFEGDPFELHLSLPPHAFPEKRVAEERAVRTFATKPEGFLQIPFAVSFKNLFPIFVNLYQVILLMGRPLGTASDFHPPMVADFPQP